EFRIDAVRFDLDLLNIVEQRILPGPAIDDAIGHDAIDRVAVLGGAGSADLYAAFDVARIYGWSKRRKRLGCARFRQMIKFLDGDVVGHDGTRCVDERDDVRYVNPVCHSTDFHFHVELQRLAKKQIDLGDFSV